MTGDGDAGKSWLLSPPESNASKQPEQPKGSGLSSCSELRALLCLCLRSLPRERGKQRSPPSAPAFCHKVRPLWGYLLQSQTVAGKGRALQRACCTVDHEEPKWLNKRHGRPGESSPPAPRTHFRRTRSGTGKIKRLPREQLAMSCQSHSAFSKSLCKISFLHLFPG